MEIYAKSPKRMISKMKNGFFRNNAACIQSWLGVLKGDKRFIVSAASKAEMAVELILAK